MTTQLISAPTAVPCPPWCVSTGEQHAQDDPGAPLHRGPRFRDLWTYGDVSGDLWADVEMDGLSASALRQLAADALAAAEWIEAHR